MQALADRTVPIDRAGDWTHAVMDLGATVCRPRAPRCRECPVASWCRYAAEQGSAAATPPSVRAPAARRSEAPPIPFPSTNRWLRGRILDRVRAARDGEWVALDVPIGEHDEARVLVAARAMARDGVLELRDAPGGSIAARLPVS